MRAFTLHHRDTKERETIACIQQVKFFLDNRDPEDWVPVYVRKRRRWRQ